jgi:uncharacterized membrane protein
MEEQNTQNYQPAPAGNQNGMAIAGMVLGICAVVFVFIFWILGIIMAIVGLVLSIMARKQNPSSMATAGLVLNIVALAITIVVVLACTACIASYSTLPFIN